MSEQEIFIRVLNTLQQVPLDLRSQNHTAYLREIEYRLLDYPETEHPSTEDIIDDTTTGAHP
jgi:hypothetical protein